MRPVVTILAFLGLCFASLAGTAARASDGGWQCVTFARSYSGIQIRGNAHSWWDQAAGLYDRSSRPEAGAVLVMKAIGKGGMRYGHVATVTKVVGAREVLLTHANWNGDGRVERDVRAIDVSPNNDWSQVRVWYSPINAIGLTAYPSYGFILPKSGTTTIAANAFPAAAAQSL